MVDNVRWGAFQCPTVETVERHMNNWASLAKCSRVVELIEAALTRWGHNYLLDWPTRLQVVVNRTDATTMRCVVEVLYVQMWRDNTPDPMGVAELKRTVPEILWVHAYLRNFALKYKELFQAPDSSSAASSLELVKEWIRSPVAFFVTTESSERDSTWLQAMPNEALRLFMLHVLDLHQIYYLPQIQGGAHLDGQGNV